MGKTIGKCPRCGVDMPLSDLYRHMRNYHGMSEEEITEFKKTYRNAISEIPCEQCHKVYGCKSSLNRHMKVQLPFEKKTQKFLGCTWHNKYIES